MSYTGFGQTAEPPKDSSQTMFLPPKDSSQTTHQVASEPRFVAAPISSSPQVPRLLPESSSPVSDWRKQIQRILDGVAAVVATLPGDVVAQLLALLAGLGAAVRQEGEELSRALLDPTKSDVEVAEKLKAVSDRYRSLRPSLPAPVVRLFDPIVEGAVGLVPSTVLPSGTIQLPSQLDGIPWLWVTGSFVAGMFVCSLLSSPKKTTPNRRRGRRSRR